MGCSRGVPGLFRGVPGCSGGVPGMFRGVPGVFRGVPGFTDTPSNVPFLYPQNFCSKLVRTSVYKHD